MAEWGGDTARPALDMGPIGATGCFGGGFGFGTLASGPGTDQGSLQPHRIGLLFGRAIFVLGQVFPLESDLAVAGSTLLSAAAFSPVCRRVQAAVDRRFNRSRFDAERTMDALSRRLATEVDLDALSLALRHVATETMQPRQLGVWLR